MKEAKSLGGTFSWRMKIQQIDDEGVMTFVLSKWKSKAFAFPNVMVMVIKIF